MPLSQAWDGHGYKDRNEDKPLSLHRSYLRVGRNRLSLSSYDSQPHFVVVVLCEPRPASEVVEAVKREHTLLPSKAFAHMKATFGEDDDDDIEAGPAKLSLACPLSHTRIQTAARGATCRHLECFDLASFIECASSTSHPRWTCPLCAAPCRPHQLRIDSWTTNVLETSPADRLEVEVSPDGTFGAVPDRTSAGGSQGGTSAQRKRKAAALSEAAAAAAAGGSGTSASGPAASGEGGSAAVGGSGGGSSGGGGVEPVVLEIDDGEDEDHPICLSDDDD